MAKNKKTAPRLVVQSETLRRLSATTLAEVAGGYASHACDNQSFGFLCGEVCGGSKSCQQ